MAIYPGFLGGSVPAQSVMADGERAVNLYVERLPDDRTALYPTPGFTSFAAAGITDTNGRGAISVNGRTFVVIGMGLYELGAGGSVIRRATVDQDANLAQLVTNGSTGGQLGIASGGNAYCYTLATNVLTQVLTGECTQIGFLDGYFLAFNARTGRVRLSNLNDGTTWDPTQFALRSVQPDSWGALIVNPPDVWLLGELSSDVWYDAGSSPFPLAARQGLAIPYGIAAPFSLAVTGGTVFWLAKNKDGAGLVVRAKGYAPEVISAPDLATAISTYQRTSTISDAEALVYQQEGHTFYVLRFPTANATWAYDLTTGLWAERGKWNSAAMRYDVWAPRCHVAAFGLHLTGDATTGTIATMDITAGAEVDGTAIRRLRRAPVLIRENRRQSIASFELGFEPGLGTASGQGVNPQVMLRASPDGGKTWGNERAASLGPMGQYGVRAFWSRLGAPRQWVPEITVSDPVPLRIINAYLNRAA